MHLSEITRKPKKRPSYGFYAGGEFRVPTIPGLIFMSQKSFIAQKFTSKVEDLISFNYLQQQTNKYDEQRDDN